MRPTYLSALVLSVLVLATGCATAPDKRTDIEFDTYDSPKGEIENVSIYQTKNKSFVTGLIKRRGQSRILNGHLHINVFSPNQARTDSLKVGYRFPRRGTRVSRSAKFNSALSETPSKGSRVVIEHHDQNHKEPASIGVLEIE